MSKWVEGRGITAISPLLRLTQAPLTPYSGRPRGRDGFSVSWQSQLPYPRPSAAPVPLLSFGAPGHRVLLCPVHSSRGVQRVNNAGDAVLGTVPFISFQASSRRWQPPSCEFPCFGKKVDFLDRSVGGGRYYFVRSSRDGSCTPAHPGVLVRAVCSQDFCPVRR